jgi:hypothetical protein
MARREDAWLFLEKSNLLGRGAGNGGDFPAGFSASRLRQE